MSKEADCRRDTNLGILFKAGKTRLLFAVVFSFFILSIFYFSPITLAENSPLPIQNQDAPLSAQNHLSGPQCWSYDGNFSGCAAQGTSTCIWKNNNGTSATFPFCVYNYTSFNTTYINITNGSLLNTGCCSTNFGSGGSSGCYGYDANQTACQASSNCEWKANNQNQNPWCSNTIGCCQQVGCWSFNNNNATCVTSLNGACRYVNKTADPYCPSSDGCCYDKSCTEVTTQADCTNLKNNLGKQCEWTGSVCQYQTSGGGGFGFYNSTDSCLTQGGWWNGSSCAMPTGSGGGSGGGGGFLYSNEARCWFADNKPSVCANVTGCVYCSNTTTQINNASSGCYNVASGFCQGHDSRSMNWNGSTNINILDTNQSGMSCGDIRLKQICGCGPLPNCVWSNSSVNTGNYCAPGIKTDSDKQTCQAPVQFCEDPLAKNNQTLCNQLASNYMMPCKWDNSSTAKNCTFNSGAVFGSGAGAGSTEYTLINGEVSCLSAGGTWKTEYYQDGASLKQDSWCEKGATYSFTQGKAVGNKGNCDTDCWACEFNATGTNYGGNLTTAQAACLNSQKSVCVWENDTNAPNSLGWCDYPEEFSFGSSTACSKDCKACEFSSNAYTACTTSSLGCTWVNETDAPKGGFCMSSSKKSCINDCFSCFDEPKCANSSFHASLNCSWDNAYKFCKPTTFTGEVCFNGKDDDGDNTVDCSDTDCTYDQFCGGANIGGSSGFSGTDCKKQSVEATCKSSKSSSGKNCTWVTQSWGGSPYCDYPGSTCWQYHDNSSACITGIGCKFKNTTTTPSIPGYCEINKTKADSCSPNGTVVNESSCGANSGCRWVNSTYSPSGGWCEFKLYSACTTGNAYKNESSCSAVANCAWQNYTYSQNMGYCNPVCFSLNETTCGPSGNGFCTFKGSMCEPELFNTGGTGGGGGGVGCHQYDTNYTGCTLQNVSCSWKNFSFCGDVSQGSCNEKGQQAMFEGMDNSPPKIIGKDASDTSLKEIDIRDFGLKDTDKSLAFGVVVTNMTNGSACNGYYLGGFGGTSFLGTGNATTKFHWFLDTNKNTADGCNMSRVGGSNESGYEFLIKYSVSVNNKSVTETKSFFKCVSGTWSSTNIPITSNRELMCAFGGFGEELGGVMVVVDKENLGSFTEYNKTAPLRIAVSTANESYSELNPLDSTSASYYTPGTADFKFVDCSNPDIKDDKCKNFQKYGFNIFEDCKNNKDDDSDGLADCADSKCSKTPQCSGTAFSFAVDVNDQESPMPVFTQVDTLHNGAFIRFDSTEPANGTITYYHNDSACTIINKTINDLGDPKVTYDDYKPFHMVPIDDSTSLTLINGTTYFYKTKMCDPSGNCADSACLNFTTKTENSYKNFIFKMKLPAGFNATIPALGYSGNFTIVSGGVLYETGIKTNASLTKNMNITINCGTQSLTFVGVDILKPKSIDLSTAFVCDSSANVLGMNSTSKSWNQVVTDLGMGGYSDYLKLVFPLTYDSANTVKWCDDALTNCSTVTSYAACSSGGSGKTTCNIPTSLGFSAYQVTASTGTGGTSGSGGSGGSGGGSTATTTPSNATTTPTTGAEPEAESDEAAAPSAQPKPAGSAEPEADEGINTTILLAIVAGLLVVGAIAFYLKKR